MQKRGMTPVEQSTVVEVQITDGSLKSFTLPDDDILRNKKVTGLCIYKQDAAGNGRSPLDRPFINAAALAEGYLNIQCDNADVLESLPLAHLSITDTEKGYYPVDLTGISPTKSSVDFSRANNLTTGESVLIGVTYID